MTIMSMVMITTNFNTAKNKVNLYSNDDNDHGNSKTGHIKSKSNDDNKEHNGFESNNDNTRTGR